MSTDLKIHQKWEDMAAYAYIVLRNLPKSERFTLGVEIRAAIWRGIKLIIKAKHEKDRRRTARLLYDLDGEIKTVQAMIRVGRDMKIVDHKKYANLSAKLVELGKMTGGWIKART